MKNSNRGNIFFLISLLLMPLLLMAGSVSAKLERPIIYPGESAVLTITAKGEDITFPKIDEIGGFAVLGTSSAQSIVMINGRMEKSLSKSYTFTPTKSVQIPSYEVEVDGKRLKTAPLSLRVAKPTAAAKGAPAQLLLRLDKKSAYVGEPVKLDLVFRRLPSAKYDKVEISEPELKDFWVKKIPTARQTLEGDYITQTYSFILFPQKEGNFTIPATFAKLGIAHRKRLGGMLDDPFFNDPFFSGALTQMEWKKLFSNEAHLEVKPLPGNLEIYGDFTIDAKTDKTTVHANKPVNLTITIKGSGNLDDISKFDPDIDNAVVYADDPKTEGHLQGEQYVGTFTQKIAIVADRDYTIPPIRFTYFDAKTKRPKTIETKPIKIHVTGASATAPAISKAQQQPAPKIESAATLQTPAETAVKEPIAPASSSQKYLWLAEGFIGGIALTLLAQLLFARLQKQERKEIPIIRQIARARDDQTLMKILLPYAKQDPVIKETLERLERNIYQNAKEKIDKEALYEVFEEMAESEGFEPSVR